MDSITTIFTIYFTSMNFTTLTLHNDWGKIVNNSLRTDLLDLSGTVRVSDLTAVDSISNGRMAAVRGFSMGLMDLEGNWISRYSIYDNIEQD